MKSTDNKPGAGHEKKTLRITDNPLDHLLGPEIRTVLIKGEPGTGKTTIAIELLKGYGNGLYVSTRVSRDMLVQQNPHIRGLVENGSIGTLEINDKTDFKFEDYRLAQAQDVLHSILLASKSFQKESLIVLDSWDSIASKMEVSDRIKTEQSLLTIAEANNVKLLFVSEEEKLNTTDYLVDAVVRLEDDVLEGMRVRRVVWKKLRGSMIPHRSSLYTLEGGKVTIFPPTAVPFIGEYLTKKFVPIRNIGSFYSSGSQDFDDFLGGGFRKSSMVLLELDNRMGANWSFPIVWSIEMNFLSNDCNLLIFPSRNRQPPTIKEGLRQYFPESLLQCRLRIMHYDPNLKGDPCFVELDPDSAEKSNGIFGTVLSRMKGKRNRPCFFFFGLDNYSREHMTGPLDPLEGEIARGIRRSGDLALLYLRQDSPLVRELNNTCDLHLKLGELDRTLVLHSVKPPSELFHIEYDYEPGFPMVKVKAIV